MKSLFRLLTGVGLCLALAITSAPAFAAQTLKVADVHPDGYPTTAALANMGKKIEKESNGRLKTTNFFNGVLGDEKQMLEQTQIGAIDIFRVSLSIIATIVPETAVFNLPYVVRDEEHMHKILDGPLGKEIEDKINKSSANLIVLGWMDAGNRSLLTKNPVSKIEDLKGMKIRVQGNPVMIDTLNALGANAISMGMGEVYTALQTGIIDGIENNPPTFTSQNYQSMAKHYGLTRHAIIPEPIVMSKMKWDRLSKEDQTLLFKLGRAAQDEERVLWAEYTQKSLDIMKKDGVVTTEFPYEQLFQMTESVRQKYGANLRDLITRFGEVK